MLKLKCEFKIQRGKKRPVLIPEPVHAQGSWFIPQLPRQGSWPGSARAGRPHHQLGKQKLLKSSKLNFLQGRQLLPG